jgi:hypothetical protein
MNDNAESLQVSVTEMMLLMMKLDVEQEPFDEVAFRVNETHQSAQEAFWKSMQAH